MNNPKPVSVMSNIVKKSVPSLLKQKIVMANVVTRAAHSLSLAEKRILMAGIARLGGKNERVKISAAEYAETYDVSLNTAYDQLKAAVENIFDRYLQFQVWEGKKEGIERIRWIGGYRYFDKEGYVRFGFSNEIFPYLFELSGQFTQYQLKQAAALRSLHSWRLLELFEQMRGNDKDGWLFMPIEEFWHAMESPESYRKNFQLLRKRIIEPAVKELTEKDGWLIEWEAVKSGRRVASLRFRFERNPQGGLFSQDVAPVPKQKAQTSAKK
jgi:plasmid replication initiation protein